MASVRDTVYNMLVAYPSLFTTVNDCYIHLFITNGGGYEWVDGELVDVCRDEPRGETLFEDDEDAEMLKRLSRMNDKPVTEIEGSDYLRIQIRRERLQVQFVKDNIDLMFDESGIITKKNLSYSGRAYSNMCRIPDDIKDDWKKAIRDFMFDLQPDVNQRVKYNEYELQGLAELFQDIKWLEKEYFPQRIVSQEIINDMMKRIKDRVNDE